MQTTDQDDWDNELNRFFGENAHVRAVSTDNEQIRFALMLKDGLKKSEVRFGDGYFNAVLAELLATAFIDSAIVQDKLREIAASKPHQGRVYRECVEMIESAIATCAQNLLKDLGYEQPLAEKILAGAVGYYPTARTIFAPEPQIGRTWLNQPQRESSCGKVRERAPVFLQVLQRVMAETLVVSEKRFRLVPAQAQQLAYLPARKSLRPISFDGGSFK